ncbi:hypothetical protein ACFLZ0_01410 [Patescibacteria group bacterium]
MFIVILYILIAFSFIGLGIIIIRKIPVVFKLSDKEISILYNKKGIIQKCLDINFRQYFFSFIVKLEKFLRKMKIVFIKMENVLGKWICKLSGLSKMMSHRSREWIRCREKKRLEKKNSIFLNSDKDKKENNLEISDDIDDMDDIKIVSMGGKKKDEESKNEISFSDLEKPTREEQRWIDLIVENPKNITAYKFLGLLYWRQHNYVDAKASLEMAIKLGSRDKKVKEIIKEIKEKNKEDKNAI